MSGVRNRIGRLAVLCYLLLLVASHIVRLAGPAAGVTLDPGERSLLVPRIHGKHEGPHVIRLAWLDLPADSSSAPVVVVLHGSPGDNGQVRPFSEALAGRFRVITPDLPGFGASTRPIPDYSIAAHARYVLALLDSLGIRRAHLVGYSLGGGVAIHLADLTPGRVASLVLLSSIGVQEYELLGDYTLNHALHGLQLAGLWACRELIPHFGWLDDVILSVEYARNFYDTDQRPLRGILEGWAGETLIIQGREDILVPPGIAQEHARIVPQSEVVMLPAGGHFMIFTDAGEVARRVGEFLLRVEQGEVATRATASPDRLSQAAQPFDPRRLPRPYGFTLAVVLVLLAAATLVSEDLACISAGLLVGRGSLGFLPATIACLIGITVGDLLLFLAGRGLGRRAVRRAPLRWLVSDADLARASHWFSKQGLRLVVATRFMPGTRLPTYVAAGILRTSLPRFALAFVVAATLWTPLLVGGSALVGGEVLERIAGYRRIAAPLFLASAVTLLLLVRLGISLATWRGRRMLLSRWRRLTRWEFWPLWVVYPPVVLYVLWLGIKRRSLTLFTCANPAIPGGGLVGESKQAILEGLRHAPDRVAAHTLIPAALSLEGRVARLLGFLAENRLSYPIVLKPDVGERGSGVAFLGDPTEARTYLAAATDDVVAQEYVPGHEFGIFYLRVPEEAQGRIFAITDKRLPAVTGDGRRTLERLILADDRAVCSAKFFQAAHWKELDRVPARGEIVPLTRLGTHSRGALFLDGGHLATPALARAVDDLSRGYDGFYFGRYDVRAASAEALAAGGPFQVIELNGVSSEATSIYDPSHALLHAYRTLFAQWRLAFEIGAQNRARGAKPVRLRQLIALLRRHRRATRAHVQPLAGAGPAMPAGMVAATSSHKEVWA